MKLLETTGEAIKKTEQLPAWQSIPKTTPNDSFRQEMDMCFVC